MSTRTGLIIVVLVAAIGATVVILWPRRVPEDSFQRLRDATQARRSNVIAVVPDNRSPEVQDGFRGNVHPLLHGSTKLEVTAYWTSVAKRRDEPSRKVPGMPEEMVNALYYDAKPARQKQIYTERDFSGFLPDTVEAAGQLWALDGEKITAFLKQFHPAASLHLMAKGRRAGPDGAFAILRAISPSHLDIVCRIHAEFNVTPKDASSYRIPFAFSEGASSDLPVTVWYTPAFFSGRMIVNRKAGTVDFFQLGIPTDRSLNAHLTVALPRYTDKHDIVRVDRMELIGGDSKLADALRWEGAIDSAQAHDRLARQFYKFKDIDWIPLEKALARAQDRKKPIMAIITWGALDDQSC